MAKHKKKRARNRARSSAPIEQVKGHAKASLAETSVDNPYFDKLHQAMYGDTNSNPRHIKAQINMNESPAAHWYHKNLIDTAQMEAANHFRALWERSGATGASAMDYSAIKVDTSGTADPVSMRVADAVMQLKEISVRLGPGGYVLVRDLCGECIPLGRLFAGQYEQRKQSEKCRDMLDILAVFLGYKTQPIRAQRG